MTQSSFFSTFLRCTTGLLLVVAFLLGSCQKESSPDAAAKGSIAFKADGKPYQSEATATIFEAQGLQLVACVVAWYDNGNMPKINRSFGLDFFNTALFAEGTYDYSGDTCDSNTAPCAAMGFNPEGIEEPTAYDSINDADGRLTLKITQAEFREGGKIIGTFSGRIFNEAGAAINITDGTFELPVVK